ncbi:MAG: ABC-F family ATP-binding cassette domain-containing protein [Anaerolineales bacterium]|nr:ABC-F family ATP-binding cassette domain-containing protein [Anaerolineales bacterium]MCX7756376.1 ABC-F family ATP-binding cassette domain-containing protein [Anaerolineales bacterium]MDW8276710.1 ABC-F family ATP-binding cassette domain-containing protein [Anaerolineales bacterium]
MSLLTVNALSKSYGHLDIFRNLTFGVAKGARLGIVGPNGVGKTTLLRILAGVDEPSSGSVHRARGTRIGYLPQEADFQTKGTLWAVCESVFADLIQTQQELARLEQEMSGGDDAILERYGRLQHEFERRGGYTYPTRIRQVLSGLGFEEDDYALHLDHLSGGQRTRAFLAQLLLSDPDVLLLDEPTNHLDMKAVEWLEGYLSQWEGAAVIVSHDRYFLDAVVNGILEMTAAGVEEYRGNYSHYLTQRQERWERRAQVFESEKEKLLREVEYIKKNISGQNTLQAKGKLRRLTRLVQAIEQVGLEAVLNTNWSQLDIETTTSPFSVEEAERRVRALRLPEARPPRLHLRLSAQKRSGELVLRTRNLLVGWPGKPLFRAPDIELRRTECAALIGPNGAGKSTFLKTILGQLPPLEGEVLLGASLHIGYFAQAHEGLNPNNTLIEEIQAAAPHLLPAEARQYLGKFLFSGDDAFKKVEVLSGGERGRLALAKLALSDTNLLLLDEPTNHLDIPSQEILEEVLEAYPGTILLVTHDRYLVDALATQIWEIEPTGSQLTVFLGTYSQMKEERERLAALALLEEQERAARTSNPRAASPRPSSNSERQKKAHLQALEEAITALEAELAAISRQLENPPTDPAQVAQLGRDYERIQRAMDEKLAQWEELQR